MSENSNNSNYTPSPEVAAAVAAIEAVPFIDKKGIAAAVKAAIAHRSRCKIMREAEAGDVPAATASVTETVETADAVDATGVSDQTGAAEVDESDVVEDRFTPDASQSSDGID